MLQYIINYDFSFSFLRCFTFTWLSFSEVWMPLFLYEKNWCGKQTSCAVLHTTTVLQSICRKKLTTLEVSLNSIHIVNVHKTSFNVREITLIGWLRVHGMLNLITVKWIPLGKSFSLKEEFYGIKYRNYWGW